MPPRKPTLLQRRQPRPSELVLLFICASHGGFSLAQSPFPGQTFTYSNPPLDVATATADRDKVPRTRSDRTIVVRGSRIDPSDPSYIFFSAGQECQFTDVYPVIAVYDGNEWNTISFTPAENHFWTHVYPPSPFGDRELMYAVSAYYCGDPGGIYIYRSADRGQSWTVSTIEKHYLSNFLSLRMEADGTGEIIVQSDNDADPFGGHHVYRTSDWGDTWSEPEFSETILAPAARPGQFATRGLVDEIARAAVANPFQRYLSIPELMQDIADEYALYAR